MDFNIILAKKLKVPVEQVNLVLSLVLCIPLGVVYRTVFSPRRVPPVVRQAVGLVWGLGISWFNLGSDLLILLAICALCYVLTWRSSPTIVHKVVFAWGFVVLSACQFYRMVMYYGDNRFDYTGRLMLIFQKLTYVACSLHDGRGRNEKDLSEDQRKQKIDAIPSVLEYFAYMFHYSTIMVGPTLPIKDYREFITGQDIQKYDKDTSQEPWPFKTGLLRFLHSLCHLLGFIVLSPILSFKRNIDPDFINSSPLLWRIFHAWFSIAVTRMKYYFVFIIGEACAIISGLGFTGYDANGTPQWEGAKVVNFHKVEVPSSIRDCINNWNIFTVKWLRSVVYERIPHYKAFLTFVVSMVWHGFYPAYLFVAINSYLFLTACKMLRRRFLHIYDNLSQPAYTILTTLQTISCCLMLEYCLGPFLLLRLDYSITLFRSVYFYGHIALVFTLLVLRMTRKESTSVQKDSLGREKTLPNGRAAQINGVNNNANLRNFTKDKSL